MKKFVVLCCLALAFASCKSEQPSQVAGPQGIPLANFEQSFPLEPEIVAHYSKFPGALEKMRNPEWSREFLGAHPKKPARAENDRVIACPELWDDQEGSYVAFTPPDIDGDCGVNAPGCWSICKSWVVGGTEVHTLCRFEDACGYPISEQYYSVYTALNPSDIVCFYSNNYLGVYGGATGPDC